MMLMLIIDNMINTNKKGFSLIELSIVLIIIGLLVAGITGGASLIKSAELRAVMTDIRNYQTAVNAYYTSRGELPGTSGSSEMNFDNSCLAWAQMVNEGIVDANLTSFSLISGTKQYTCDPITSVTANDSVGSKMKGGFYALGYNDEMLSNVIFLVGSGETVSNMKNAETGSGTAKLSETVVSRKDAKFLDDKMDNGISNSGKIYGFTGEAVSTAPEGCVYNNSSTTLANETVRDCGVAVSIGL